MISPANALKLSMWLAATHPKAFEQVLRKVTTPPRPSNLGHVQATYIPRTRPRPRAGVIPEVARRGRLGAVGDVEPITIEPLSVDDINFSMDNAIFSNPTLEDINFSADDLSLGTIDLPSAAASVDNSGGFWSTLGQGLSSIGSGLSSAVGTVAHALTNPQVLQSAGQIATQVIASNAQAQQAQLQQSVLQAQLQRTTTGAGAAPVQYAVNPLTGQQQPYYYNASTGQYQLAQPQMLNAGVSSFSALTPYLPYLLIGGGVLLVIAMMRNS